MKRAFTSLLLLVGGCGPSEECRSYLQCQRAIDASVDVAAYDDGGACWALPQAARECTATCVQALAALRELPELPAICRE